MEYDNIMSEDTCDGCVHKPNGEREYYDVACFDCSWFYADKYTKIDDGEE